MQEIQLKYGQTAIPFTFNANRFKILGEPEGNPPLSDVQIGERLDNPIDSETIENIVHPGQRVLFVVSDATRQTACGQIINLLVRRLIANGTAPYEISAIFATGIHRAVTEAEKKAILTPFITQRIKTLEHGPRDLMRIMHLGETSFGIPVELNRALVEHDHVILIGGVSFHYFAGFTGGRKLICPGLASSKTITATHKLAFDCERKERREGVGPGRLDGNLVNEAFMGAVARINPSFCVNTIVNGAGQAVDLTCGSWISSHRRACESYAASNTVRIREKRDLVIVSCGGYPYDINMIQAQKALQAASLACIDGGTIALVAQCTDGVGGERFLNWFEGGDSEKVAIRLCESYSVNGQTAWSLLKLTERFRIKSVSSLEAPTTQKLKFEQLSSLHIGSLTEEVSTGYIMPFGSRTLVEVEDASDV
ncbi:MAG: nickel-dependent lactate racemase [Pyrinomonadaceae bacterium]